MKQRGLFILILNFSVCILAYSQIYDDYIGAGHAQGVTVYSSSNQGPAIGENTINGSGMDAMKMEASRFLAQAAFGGSPSQIEALAATENDFSAWIDAQIQEPASMMLPKLYEVDQRAETLYYIERDTNWVDENGERPYQGAVYFGPWAVHFQYAWSDNNLKGSDQLRQRMAYALSQILVISVNSQLTDFGEGLASYYDHFMEHAFGNYKDILMDITLDPNMGFYLSHLNNNKTDESRGIVPDQNFAREIMQLFTIGLYELNNDGTRKVDGNGDWIPTYDNDDIIGLSKVFTGLKGGRANPGCAMYFNDPNNIDFGTDIYCVDRTFPMKMDADQHEPGTKTIVGNFTIPGGQTGMEDIEDAVDHLFMHDNVGPFLARRLIQQFIKSNPTPAYINRVANAFNDNGSGVRGDMEAVLRAILLDQEARECGAMQDPSHGKLREPMLRYTQFANVIPKVNPDGYFWNNGYHYLETTKQSALSAPSVFNFYLPDYQAGGEITNEGLVSPEFQIHDSQTALGYMNMANMWTGWNEYGNGGTLFWDWIGTDPYGNELTKDVTTDLTGLATLAGDPETLINYLDVMFTHGRLSQETRAIIKNAIAPIQGDSEAMLFRARQALYLIMISPDYVVLK